MEHRPKIFVLDLFHADAIAALQCNKSVDITLPEHARKDVALASATGILVRSDTRITAADLDSTGQQLKFIVKQGVGVDNIDLDAAKARGVGVYNTPGVNSEAVAELTITLALCIARRITEFDRQIRSGERVQRSKMLGKSLFKTRLGIIGMGAIGFEVAKKWTSAMGGTVVGFDPRAHESSWKGIFDADVFVRAASLDDVLRQADVVSLHVPLNPSTENLISDREFNLMKPDSILLNCARGGIVDEAALLKALQSGKLFGAGLDAMVHEPPTMHDYGETLLNHPRVVMSPHVGAGTAEIQSRSGVRAVEIMLDLVNGRGSHKSIA